MCRHHRMLITAGAALMLACPLSAGPLQESQISAKAKWFVHADVKGFLASETGAFVLKELKKKGLEDVLFNVNEVFGLDLTKDLHSLTVYGTTFGKEATINAQRSFNHGVVGEVDLDVRFRRSGHVPDLLFSRLHRR